MNLASIAIDPTAIGQHPVLTVAPAAQIGLAGLLILIAYYYFVWRRIGRYSGAATAVPTFAPPRLLSPPAVRFLIGKDLDERALAAAFVDLGSKGHIRLAEGGQSSLLDSTLRLERIGGREPLPPDEIAMVDRLFGAEESLVLGPGSDDRLIAARARLWEYLEHQFCQSYYSRDERWSGAGFAAFCFFLWATCVAVARASHASAEWEIVLNLGCFATAFLLWITDFGSRSVSRLINAARWIGTIVACLAAIPVLTAALESGHWLPLLLPTMALPVVWRGLDWTRVLTPEGRTVLSEVEGFRRYLATMEPTLTDRTNSPTNSPQLFEKYLPYAIALDVNEHSKERFDRDYAALVARDDVGFPWYSGSRDPWIDPEGFVDLVRELYTGDSRATAN